MGGIGVLAFIESPSGLVLTRIVSWFGGEAAKARAGESIAAWKLGQRAKLEKSDLEVGHASSIAIVARVRAQGMAVDAEGSWKGWLMMRGVRDEEYPRRIIERNQSDQQFVN